MHLNLATKKKLRYDAAEHRDGYSLARSQDHAGGPPRREDLHIGDQALDELDSSFKNWELEFTHWQSSWRKMIATLNFEAVKTSVLGSHGPSQKSGQLSEETTLRENKLKGHSINTIDEDYAEAYKNYLHTGQKFDLDADRTATSSTDGGTQPNSVNDKKRYNENENTPCAGPHYKNGTDFTPSEGKSNVYRQLFF